MNKNLVKDNRQKIIFNVFNNKNLKNKILKSFKAWSFFKLTIIIALQIVRLSPKTLHNPYFGLKHEKFL